MKIVILDSEDQVADAAADTVQAQIAENPRTTLGLATGRTPILLYETLVKRHREGRISFADVTSFNLDEYVGLSPDDARSYSHYMNQHLFSKVDLQSNNIFLPTCPDVRMSERICREYEADIDKFDGIDIQVLGIGANGHIGFNEPSSSFGSRTRIKTLTSGTLRDNQLPNEMNENAMRLAITMGIATIMEARSVILLATGVTKAAAVAAAVEGPVSAMCPASILQFHQRATFYCDRGAASELRNTNYYGSVYEQEIILRRQLRSA